MKLNTTMILKLAALTLASMSIAGCKRTAPPEVPNQPIGSAEWVAQYRASIEASAPGSLVGVVNAVLPNDHLASLTDVAADQFHEGQRVTFVDGSGNPLGVGSVLRAGDGQVHVRYETPQPGRRAPEVGDVAVWLKR